MPRQVDHHQRRQLIAEAAWGIAADRGMEAVSMREVATAAGMSTGQVQHYFATKDELVLFAARHLRERVDRQIRDRIAAAPTPRTPFAVLRATLAALLPLEQADRTAALAGIAVFIRALNDPELAATYRNGHRQIVAALADQIAAAKRSGELRADLDPDLEANMLATFVTGLASAALSGNYSADRARVIVDHHLNHLKP